MSEKDKDLTNVKVHEGRLRKLLQFLKEKEAIITVDRDIGGRVEEVTYSSSSDINKSLKDLMLSIWSETTVWTYYEYLKEDFKISRKKTVKQKLDEAQEKFIVGIECTFLETPRIEQQKEKQQLFFSGDRRQATNVHAAYPDFRKNIKEKVSQFRNLLNNDDGFPYQSLRNQTSLRCHRYKKLEKGIFQYLKDSEESVLNKIGANLKSLMTAYIKHLDDLERKGIGHGDLKGGDIVKNRLTFKELSIHDGKIEITEKEEDELQKIGFQKGFSTEDSWFDRFRFKKLAYWKDALEDLPISAWPEYYLEQILLSYFELNAVCGNIIKLRDRMFDQVGYIIKYSDIETKVVTIGSVLSLRELSTELSKYEYVSNSFTDALRSDGNLLTNPLRRLPKKFKEIRSSDDLFHSRIEELVWKYMIYRMCDSCQLNKKYVAAYDSPIQKYEY